ncbi:MAG: prolyl oligopeptidase family serine peptidase [Planctomycetes bacterium]|nr:prolyl oligopeptidase family serine peptidase [Planctomycetota bacterium]MCB9935386.1 prolyl oligopeptidase family serine peptidase [Planctomycetota bacterium]
MKTLLLTIPLLLLGGCAIELSEKIESDYEAVALPKQQLEYRVYLPPQYERESAREFPLLVYFHGGGGSHRTWGAKGGLGERMLPKMEAEEFGPFIVLAPSVGRLDVIAGESERVLFEEIIPRVRREYRANDTTIAFGHSMGGLSAMMLSLRHPQAFDAVAAASPFAYDVSPFEPEERIQAFEDEYGDSFYLDRWQSGVAGKFGDIKQFEAYSPFEQVRRLDRKLPFKLFITTGTEDQMGLYPQNRLLHEELNRKGIEHEFLVQQGVAHSTIREPRLYKWIDEQADRARVSGTAGGN